MTVWNGDDYRRGGSDSLALLYALVPVCEEFDLLDQLEADRLRAEWEARLPPESDDVDEQLDDTTADAPSRSTEPVPTVREVIGLLEHYLGAELMHEDEDEPPDA